MTSTTVHGRGGALPGMRQPRGSEYENITEEIDAWVRENNLPGYPVYYPETARFLLGSQPSGLRGAEASVRFTLANYPHLIFGVVLENVYEVPDDFLDADVNYYVRARDGGVDDNQSVMISLTQQNVTQQYTGQINFSGAEGTVWRPFPVIYFFRGANQVTITARRRIQYPHILATIGGVLQEFRPTPELHATLITAQLNSDLLPGSAPGSTGRP